MRRAVLLLLLFAVLPAAAQPADTLVLGLEASIVEALEVSPEVGQRAAEVDFAEARLGEARASRFLTEFQATSGHAVAPGLVIPGDYAGPSDALYLQPDLRNDWDLEAVRPYNQVEVEALQPIWTWGELGGSIRAAVSEWIALMMLGAYFPIKHALREHEQAPRYLLAVLIWLGVFVALRNLLNFKEILLSATQGWEIARGRVTTNETFLLVPGLASLLLTLYARRTWVQALSVVLFVLFTTGLVLTQSRAYWVNFLFGSGLVFLFVEPVQRRRFVYFSLIAGSLLSFFALVFFSDYLSLVVYGVVERFASLGSATTKDISLINRFYEAEDVWARIVENPILGHGMGVRYQTFDIIYDHTKSKSYTHNGPLSLWFKFGIFGLLSVLVFWVSTFWRGMQAYLQRHRTTRERLVAFTGALGLATFLPSVFTSNPFFLSDTLLMFALTAAFCTGIYERDASLLSTEEPDIERLPDGPSP